MLLSTLMRYDRAECVIQDLVLRSFGGDIERQTAADEYSRAVHSGAYSNILPRLLKPPNGITSLLRKA